MKINTMRSIDYWVGIPLCFIITLFLNITKLFFDKKNTNPKNILLVELSEMGSAILADPLMQSLKHQHHCQIFFVIFAKNKKSLNLLNTVEDCNIFTIRENNLYYLFIDCLKFFFWSRKNNIDSVIDLELFSRFSILLSFFSGAVNRVGFYQFFQEGLYRGNLLTTKVMYNPHIHIAKNFMSLNYALFSDKNNIPHTKEVIKDEEIKLSTVSFSYERKKIIFNLIKKKYNDFTDQKIVIINPNASDMLPQRRWDIKNFIIVINKILLDYQNILVLITGVKNEFNKANYVIKAIDNKRCINFCGELDITDLPVLYDMSACMLTNDSGPAHFAAITKMPTIVLYGPETPSLYGSLGVSIPIYMGLACSPCVSASNHRKTPCKDNICMKSIQPELVYEKIKSVI